jgi:hypothetical protein
MLHFPLQFPRKTHHMLQLEFKKTPNSLRISNTYANRFRIFYRSSMPSTRINMINIGCLTSFRWETKFGCTCKNNSLQGLIKRHFHSFMDLTPLRKLWVTIIFSSTFPPSLVCTHFSMWTSFNHISTIIGSLRDSRTIDTNRDQS